MLDYEEYGSNFRIPRALREDGGPANNGAALDTTQPEGRPAGSTAQPAPTASVSTPPSAPAPAPQQTFTQMQAMGLPRPPAPTQQLPAYQPSDGGRAYNDLPYGQPYNDAIPYNPNGAPGTVQGDIYQDWQTARNAPTATAPGARYTGQFTGDPSSQSMNPQIQQAIMAALGNPSRYDANVVKDSYGYLSGAIDDDYNARDERLKESMASRGLGAVGDGSIYGSNQINQNLARRSAKQNLASELLREQANTYGQDRASALAGAMGWGGQQFGQALQGFNANQGANAQNFGQDMDRAGFGLTAQGQNYNQRRGALQDYLGFGQNQFDNQYRTAQMRQQQQYQQLQLLMQLMGYGQ
jgi:hypothetical protein